MQVMNTSPSPITVYKGSKIGVFPPRDHFCVVTGKKTLEQVKQCKTSPPLPDIDLSSFTLSSEEKKQLLSLLAKFADIFAIPGGSLGQTSVVKHTIQTEGPLIRQALQRMPESMN